MHKVFVGDQEYRAKSVILAMGAEPKKLGVPGEDELAARGVSYCATCDAAFFRDKPTIVVGGGDTAMEDALFLAKFAKDVKIVHRRDEFRASAIMLDRAKDTENIELLTPYVVETFEAGEDGSLATAVLKNTGRRRGPEPRDRRRVHRDRPPAELEDRRGPGRARRRGLRADARASPRARRSPGVFAAGDLVDHTYRQAVTAAGSGCQAALDAEWYLRDRPPDPEAHWAREGRGHGPGGPALGAPSAQSSGSPALPCAVKTAYPSSTVWATGSPFAYACSGTASVEADA